MAVQASVREVAVQRAILEYFVGRTDVFIWRNNTGVAFHENGTATRYGLKGSADLLGVIQGGRFLAIETKSKTGRLTPEQAAFRGAVERLGGLYVLARSVEDVVEAGL